MDDERERQRDILLEKILSEVQATREAVTDVPEIKQIVASHTEELADIKGQLVVIEDIVRGHSRDIADLKAASHTH
jgi:hypothetical protein